MRASSERSSSERKVGILRRNGSVPGRCAVESALAMFSEMTRMRPAWARRPEAAIAIDFRKSIVLSFQCASALAERGFDQAETARVDGRRRLVVHGVGGDLHHL